MEQELRGVSSIVTFVKREGQGELLHPEAGITSPLFFPDAGIETYPPAMSRELVILTSRNKFFGQTRKPWISLDVGRMIALLEKQGWKVEQFDFHQVVNTPIALRNRIVFYAFSQKDNYRQYINDIIYHLSKDNRVIPSYDLLKCHENKGYQEIYKQAVGLGGLEGQYFTSGDEVDVSQLKFPVVLKTTEGTNSKGVFLVKSQEEFRQVLKKLRNRLGLFQRIDLFRRKYFRKRKFEGYPGHTDRQDYLGYREYLKREQNFILQEYVPGLDFDYRVLAAAGRFYVMKRSVNKGDFRASGTKKFSFSQTPDPALLDFAQAVVEKFDTPFLSLDILFNGKDYYMVEFQALHFGTGVVARSEGYFKSFGSEGWRFIPEKPELERFFAETLVRYLD